jgi:hypothetical protein
MAAPEICHRVDKDELSTLFTRYFFDSIDRSYIEVISKKYRGYIEEMKFLSVLSCVEKS